MPAGKVHSFANAGREVARVMVETRPALRMEALLETAAAMAQEQRAARRRLPRLLDLMLFMHEFEQEVRAPYLPVRLVRLVTRGSYRLARRRGRGVRYDRVRVAGTR